MAKTIKFEKIKLEASKGKTKQVKVEIELGETKLESKFRFRLAR